MNRLTAADDERSPSWNLVIAAELLRKDGADEGSERRSGPLSICRQSGAWYDFAAAIGGISSVRLIRHLKNRAGEAWSREDAEQWLGKFLETHPGLGPVEAEDGEWTEARKEASAALCRHWLETGVRVEPDSLGARYRASRELPEAAPEGMLWIADARPGEGALIMPLIGNGRVVGLMASYVDGLGKKSIVEPARRRLDIEKCPSAVMEIAAKSPGTVDIGADVIIAEGWENAESAAIDQVKSPAWRVIALAGINTLKNIPEALQDSEARIVIIQDSDPEGSPALQGLQAGVDALLAAGKRVKVTERSEYGDANDILRAPEAGPKELKRLIGAAGSGAFSFEGQLSQLAKLPETAYMLARREAAKLHKVPPSFIDKEVARRRLKPAETEAEEGSTKPSILVPVDPLWTGPIPQISPLLDRMVIAIRRHVVLKEWQAHLVAVWVALTYFVFDPRINLMVMPRLAIQSAAINSGKTALLRLVCTLVRHGKIYGRSTAAGIYRALSQAQLTLCLDEVEFLRSDPYAPMMQVLDSSHHREDANILLTEPQKVGPPIARELSTWAAMALACNGQLPGSLQSRSLVVVLSRALADDPHEPLDTRLTPELVGLRRELTAWAATIATLDIPKRDSMIPAEVFNRDGDNWKPAFAIARLAGDVWVERIREASLQSLQTESLPSLTSRLLASSDLAFGDNPKPDTWLDTSEFIARLIAQAHEQWGSINRGHAIDAYWLRTQLRGLLDPAGAQEWQESLPDGTRKHRRGYFYGQFTDALRRYEPDQLGTFTPGETHTAEGPGASGTSGSSGISAANPSKIPRKSRASSVPDGVPDAFFDPGQEKESETNGLAAPVPDIPDEPDQPAPSSACVPGVDDWGWADGAGAIPSAAAAAADAAEPGKVVQPSAAEAEKPPAEPAVTPPPRARPRTDLGPEPTPLAYIEATAAEDSIPDSIRQLRAAHPKRSLAWIAKQSGQPRTVIREILGLGEGAK